jgi:methionyl-tRNA formyltransferase
MSQKRQTGLRIFLFADFSGPLVAEIPNLMRARGHEVVGLLTAPPPKNRPRANNYLNVVEHATAAGIPTIVSARRKQWLDLVRTFSPDLGLCAGLVWKIPRNVFQIPRLGTVNIHGGPLPRYRGPNMIGWGFRNDDGYLEMTAHWMEEDWDTGPVLARQRIDYGDEDDIETLGPAWYQALVTVIDNAIASVEQGDPGEPQDESLAGYAPFFEPEWREIDWDSPARLVHNQVRSWMGGRDIPRGALATIDGQRLVVTRTRLVPDFTANSVAPGTVLSRSEDELLVQCQDGPVRVIAWQESTGPNRK